jgi:hypothetical protein
MCWQKGFGAIQLTLEFCLVWLCHSELFRNVIKLYIVSKHNSCEQDPFIFCGSGCVFWSCLVSDMGWWHEYISSTLKVMFQLPMKPWSFELLSTVVGFDPINKGFWGIRHIVLIHLVDYRSQLISALNLLLREYPVGLGLGWCSILSLKNQSGSSSCT